MDFKNIPSADYFLRTRLGTLKISIGPDGLNRLIFEECSQKRTSKDESFRDAFTAWLHNFQSSTSDEQWAALSLQGTDFQKSVWRALLEIPMGSSVSYNTIATRIGRPKANRAVGSAVGANPIAVLIPCHRVTPSQGGIGNYHWGSDRKKALLETEQIHGMTLAPLFQQA